MKTLKFITLAMLCSLASIKSISAHGEKGPHGGVMVDAKGYHVELLNHDGKVTVYLLDAKAKSMSNKGITGSAFVHFYDKTTSTVKLTRDGTDGFWIADNKAASFTSIVVTFKAKGKTITAKFKAAKITYTCPMHPEVTTTEAGQCPKCGMGLVEKPMDQKNR